MKLASTILVAVVPAASLAGPDRLSLTFGTHHTDPTIDWVEANPGIFLTWENRALGLDYSIGAFRNSFGRGSVAAAAAKPIIEWDGGDVSVFGGLAHYPGEGGMFLVHAGDIVPIGGIQLRQSHLFTQFMPGKLDPVEAIIAFGITFEISASRRAGFPQATSRYGLPMIGD